MQLNNLPRKKNITSGKKRVGRGYGSGKGGHTTGLGTKGQKARGSGKVNAGFEGGQVPLYKRIPKRPGFVSYTSKDIKTVSLVTFNRFKDGTSVTPTDLVKAGVLKSLPKHGVKILQNGTLFKKLELSGFMYTEGARKSIEKSGSKIVE